MRARRSCEKVVGPLSLVIFWFHFVFWGKKSNRKLYTFARKKKQLASIFSASSHSNFSSWMILARWGCWFLVSGAESHAILH